MKVILLAGGKGTRIAEETYARPKPMVEIGGRPILWHIMQVYSHFGFKDFLVACGYKGGLIKEYFHNWFVHHSDFVMDLRHGTREVVGNHSLDWRVGVIDTGQDTMTGGRILRLKTWIEGDRFMVTYGDGLGDINIGELVEFHKAHGKLATITAVRPPARFGDLVFNGDQIREFAEKPQTGAGWINGGFFVFESKVLDYIGGDVSLEREPLERLAADGQLVGYRHHGFWQPMDTLREKQLLETLWSEGRAPWKLWQ